MVFNSYSISEENVVTSAMQMLNLHCWFFLILSFYLLFPTQSYAININEVRKTYKDYGGLFGVIYDKRKDEYSTLSANAGEVDYEITSAPVVMIKYNHNNITMTVSTYPEFLEKIQPSIKHLRYFHALPESMGSYMELLPVKPVVLNIDYILIPNKYGVFHQTKETPVTDNIKLTFIGGVTDEQLDDIANFIEKYLMSTFAHEVFHFMAAYSEFPRIRELREETFASLFGTCVSYRINPEVIQDVQVLAFPKTHFQNPQADIKDLRKFLKKQHYSASTNGYIMANYYFQAVANNYLGGIFSSDKIPEFCHKLFSETSIKHSIEKKPPIWFQAFLRQTNNRE